MILWFFCYIVTVRLPWQPDGIKFTQCVSDQKSAFSPLQEKLCIGSKNDWHLFELSRRSLSACKVWGDRTTRAGCRSENWCFCMSRFVCLRVGDIVQTIIVWRFMGRFRFRLQRFFQNGLLCQMNYTVLIWIARWRQNFRKIPVKNYEKSKNRQKSLCAPLRIDSWEIWRKFHRSSLGPRM